MGITNLCDVRLGELRLSDLASIEEVSAAIATCLRQADLDTLRRFLEEHEPADEALLLSEVEPDEALSTLRLLPIEEQAQVFGYFPPDRQAELAKRMPRKELASLMTAMPHDDRADLYKRLDKSDREALLPGLAQAEREDVRRLAAYPEGTAGSVMTSDYATLRPKNTASEALDALRLQAPDSETIYRAFIIDDDRHLLGSVDLRTILTARLGERVADLMERDPPFVRAEESREEAARVISRYDLIALPVLDADERLAGIITPDDAIDVVEQEGTEDLHRFGTVRDLEAPVRTASIFRLYRSRITWLVLLVFGNIFSGLGIAYFEDMITAYVALVFFLPLLIASGGNAGAQAATLMVRALATGDVRASDWTRMLGREFLVASLLSITMAVAVSTIGFVRGGPEIAAVVALSMVLIVIVGSLIGMSLPFVLDRFRFDPATASAPLVTSIADAGGVVIYFSIATQILSLQA